MLLAAATAVLALAGCGSASVGELPPAAEPRHAPPLARAPAGRVVRLGPPISALTRDRTASPGGAPEGLAADARTGTVAVGLRRPAQLALVAAATGRVRRLVGLPGGPRHVATARGGGAFLVPAETADRLLEVRARDGRVVLDVPTGSHPHDVAPLAGGRIAVGDERSDTLAIVHGGRRLLVRTAAQPGGVTAIDDGRAVAVVAVRERVVETFDAATGARTGRAAAGVGPTHAVALGRWLWVTDTRGDALLVFRLHPRLELVRRVRLQGGPYGLALDALRRRLYVTLTAGNRLVELPAHGRPHPLRWWPTVRQPDDVAVDSATGRVFVGGRADGTLQLLDPATTGGEPYPQGVADG